MKDFSGQSRLSLVAALLTAALTCGTSWANIAEPEEPNEFGQPIDGYKGIWYVLPQYDAWGAKYSGGLGTYTAKHHPLAIYSEEANKTFFVFGGSRGEHDRHLLSMVGYYDHETGQVPRPRVVHDHDGVDDPHDNPTIQMDGEGRLWVFVSGRGAHRAGHVYRSVEPYSIEEFEHVGTGEFTYPQPWYVDGEGFVLMFTKYRSGRFLYWNRSADGINWKDEDDPLAQLGGHYQVSNEQNGRIITAFNMHPDGSVDRRTNLYYAESDDLGETWRTADGQELETPVTELDSPALVHDYRGEDRLVYVKDIRFDHEGNPVVLYLTSGYHHAGPPSGPRHWMVAHWQGDEWAIHEVTEGYHNYDMGSLYIEDDRWQIIAPTDPGPQQWGTGGEVAVWVSEDQGQNWEKTQQVTSESERNHGYVRRPVNAHRDFYGFWADGNPHEMGASHLYFTNQEGDTVRRLPYAMDEDYAEPEVVEPE